MRRRVLLPTTIAEAMLDRFQLIDKRERIRPMNMEIQRTRALLMLFAAAVLAAGLLALARTESAWAEPPSFVAAPNSPFVVGDAPTTVTNADFDGDGNVDLAAQNYGSNTVSVLTGNGEGTFDTKQDFTVGTNPSSVIGTDLDGDAKADLAVANYSSNTVSVLLGNGDGTFDTKQDFAVGTNPSSVVSSEFNGDGKTDLAVANYSSNTVSVLLGNGDGTFQTAQPYSVSIGGSPGPNQIITDDFNGDGDVDLATANVGSNTELARYHGGVTVLLGNGNGTFQNASKVAWLYLNYSVASADFDDDGDSDLVATSYGMTGGCCIYGEVEVALGNGDGTFGAARTFRVGSGHTGPSAVASADLNTDGHEDLAVSNSATDDVSVMLGNGDGTFGVAQNFPAGDLPAFVISPDLDADGIADLAVANQDSDNVSVLLNTAVDTTAPTISNVSPADQSQNVSLGSNVEATFSEDMDASDTDGDPSTLTTSTFTLSKQGSSTPVAAQVSYDSASRKATLDPSSDLEANTTYTATIKGGSMGAEDLAGNALAQDRTWSFTTAPPALTCTKFGTEIAETISGTSGADVICAGAGNDTVKGLGGNDILKGEAGNDKLLGGVGDDTLEGELGTDIASYSASLTAVTASLATNSSTGEGTDTFVGVEKLLGSSKADTLTGSGANNTLTGGGGGDTVRGGAGNDKAVGSGGADFLYGEDGADAVNSKDGMNGNDSLDGGAGTDTKVTDTTEKSIVGFP